MLKQKNSGSKCECILAVISNGCNICYVFVVPSIWICTQQGVPFALFLARLLNRTLIRYVNLVKAFWEKNVNES